MANYINNKLPTKIISPTTNFQRSFAPSNYIQDKYSQYQLNMDTVWPSQITDLPFYNDVYYSSSNSIGTPIFMKPSYDTLQNASYQEPFSTQQYQQYQQLPQQPMYNQMNQQPMYNQGVSTNPESFSMERNSYFNTMNAQNKEIDYKQFNNVRETKIQKPKPKPRKIIYISKNKDYIHTFIIFLLITILLLNH